MKDWRKIVFAIAICLLYIPMVYMGVNTFFPKTPRDTCYDTSVPMKMQENATDEQWIEYNRKMTECENSYQDEREKYDGWKFIVIMIINIVFAFVMLLNLDKSIIFGLFFGVVITAFTATIRYIESRTIIGFFLLIVLFGIIIYFVNSMRNKK